MYTIWRHGDRHSASEATAAHISYYSFMNTRSIDSIVGGTGTETEPASELAACAPRRLASTPSSGATMQLQNAAEGHEHKMSAVHPVWPASSSNVADYRSPIDAYGRLKHWWPSQAYHCSFCTRVFRTAQALGGHMNIHRRERACANDVGTHNNIRATPTLSEPSHSPASNMVEPGRPLFGASHRLLMTRTPPNSMAASSMSYVENCYANRRPPSQPPASTYDVSTHLQISANFAPVPTDVTTYLTDQGAPRPGCNGGYGKLKVAPTSEPLPRFVNNNISDPLTWLFSQLPPPGSALTTFQQSQSACRSNILMQRNVTKPYGPYHRALAVSKSPPGVRRHVCRIHSPLAAQNVLYTGMVQSRSRMRVEYGGSSSSSAAEQAGGPSGGPQESLDLELRL